MSKVSSLFGGDQADAAKGAAGAQLAATERAIASQEKMFDKSLEFQKESRDTARADLEPFRSAGATDITGLAELVTNPQKQLEFIQNNPFFGAMAEKAKSDILGNAAAKGKVGSGGTAEALQNSLLLLGNDLINQDVNRRHNLAALGSNAAAGQATATQNTAGQVGSAYSDTSNTIASLITQGGDAVAAGKMGAANARTNAMNNLMNTGIAALSLCDHNAKEDIKEVGTLHNGLPVYTFRYKGEDKLHMNVMAQDVEKFRPEAVHEINGLKYVDMESATWQ